MKSPFEFSIYCTGAAPRTLQDKVINLAPPSASVTTNQPHILTWTQCKCHNKLPVHCTLCEHFWLTLKSAEVAQARQGTCNGSATYREIIKLVVGEC